MARIFVINNDPDLLSLFRLWLEKNAHEAAYTTNADEIVTTAKKFKPDLLLIDQPQSAMIPEIKKEPLLKDIPVILMTDYTKSYKTKPANADSVVEKPFDLELVMREIEKLLAI